MAKHKYIETPEKMWELFEDYRDFTKNNPRIKIEYVGRIGERVETPLETPLTMEGFECYVMNLEGVQSKGLDQYFANQDGAYSEYLGICSRIKKIIRQDQIEGGMVGQYNSSITQRLNGLVDKKEIKDTGEPRVFNIGK